MKDRPYPQNHDEIKNMKATIQQHIERFQREKHHMLEAEVAQKRVAWFKQYSQTTNMPSPSSISPRQAYELLFFEYMGLADSDVPVLSETDDEIVWSSINPCPTLEACKIAGFATRKICRAVYEKSTQALISQLDPQLRFYRSYKEIRPHSHHCKEWITRVDFEQIMGLALEEARISKAEGNKGYGAVVIFGNRILGKAHDTASTRHNPSLHAEVNAIRQAVNTFGDTNLCGAILFSTCEPCPMCSSLAIWANLTTIVYGISIEETAQMGRSRIRVRAQELIGRSPAMIEVIGDVLRDECKHLYE